MNAKEKLAELSPDDRDDLAELAIVVATTDDDDELTSAMIAIREILGGEPVHVLDVDATT